jgi:7-cyano-7-deazaguanine reductase
MTRPGHPDEGVKEMEAGKVPWAGGDLVVNIATQEFTSVCPTTGQPDFNRIDIAYRPDAYYLESKTVKFYLWAFRDFGAHCETLAKRIAEDVAKAISPSWVQVTVTQSPRGGLGIVSTFTIGGES